MKKGKILLSNIALCVLTFAIGVSTVSGSATKRTSLLAVNRDGRVVQVSVPIYSADKYCLDNELTLLGRPHRVHIANAISRSYIGADYVLPGAAHKPDIMPYTGKDVVVGIIDTGIDPNHITFKDQDGNMRVARYIFTRSSAETDNGELQADIYDTPQLIESSPIDTAAGGHGTHTAGTAAGAWYGNPYAGIAQESEIVLVGTGTNIYDDEIIYGMRAVSEYATSKGKPAVLSLSLGAGVGPHDGTSPIGLVSKEIANQGHTIVFAAGNDGQRNSTIQRNFSNDSSILRTIFTKFHTGENHYIAMDVWSRDTREVEIQFMVTIGDEVIYTAPWITQLDANHYNGRITLLSDSLPGELLPELRRYFKGEIFMDMGIYAPNGKFHIALEGDISKKFYTGQRPTIGFAIRSPQGADVRIYSYPYYNIFSSWGIEGFINGTPHENISDMATSPYVVSAGMYNATESVLTLNGVSYSLESMEFGQLYEPNRYSSYGTTWEGTVLPQVLAPGSLIVSSLNTHAPGMEANYVCDTVIGGKRYVWGHDSGTSMATPMVAGTIALWLDAIPSLNYNQIIDILANSSNHTICNSFPMHSAYGVIDAYAGLKYALATYGTPGVMCDKTNKIAIRFLDNNAKVGSRIECLLPHYVKDAELAFYTIEGSKIATQRVNGTDFITRLPTMPGIYILRISANGFAASKKISVYAD